MISCRSRPALKTFLQPDVKTTPLTCGPVRLQRERAVADSELPQGAPDAKAKRQKEEL